MWIMKIVQNNLVWDMYIQSVNKVVLIVALIVKFLIQ